MKKETLIICNNCKRSVYEHTLCAYCRSPLSALTERERLKKERREALQASGFPAVKAFMEVLQDISRGTL